MLLGSDMVYVKRGSEHLFLQHPTTVFTAVPGALADHTAGGSSITRGRGSGGSGPALGAPQ